MSERLGRMLRLPAPTVCMLPRVALSRYVMALLFGYMATETATIRVARQTRDLLAAQARRRGLSLAAMLAELAQYVEREAALRSEREATRADAGRPEVSAEEREWEAVLGDGID